MPARFRWVGVVGLLVWAGCGLVSGCGEYVSGTESGNPINPPTPMTEPPVNPPETDPPTTDPPTNEPSETPTVVGPPMTGEPRGSETPAMPGAATDGMPGQPDPTAPGAVAACETSACEQQAMTAVNRLSGAQPEPTPFASAECTMSDGVLGCDCGTVIRADAVSCAATDRFGNCIYGPADFPGCAPQRASGGADSGSVTACSEVCSEVWRRMSEEAKAMYEVEVRAAACVEMECRYLISVSGSCYVAEPLASADCAKSDEELLGGL